MLLGLYFHLAINYVGEPPGGHPFFGLFMFLCHYFRMHAFFLVSGFFGALLVNRRGAKEMIKNRVNRVLYPLLALSYPIWLLVVFSGDFSLNRQQGNNIINSIISGLWVFVETPTNLIPEATMHLWFLNLLFGMSLLGYFFSKYSFINAVIFKNLVKNIFEKPWLGTFLFCFFYGLLLAILNIKEAQGEEGVGWASWIWFTKPSAIKTFVAFGFFYLVGWQMYYFRDQLNSLSVKKYLKIFVVFFLLIFPGFTTLLFKIGGYSQYEIFNEFWSQEKRKVTFNVDMSPFDFTQFADSSEFKGVYLNGSFNGWCGECDNRMDDVDGDNIFSKTILLNPGFHNFVFSVNGWDGAHKGDQRGIGEKWVSPGDKGFECDSDPNSDNDNSYEIRLINEDLILEPICWKECTDCDGNYISKIDVNRPWPPFERIVIEKGFIFAMNFLVPSTVILIMTLFIRFCSQPSKRIRYISDASYWVYVIHLPLVFFIPAFFHQSKMNLLIKFIINAAIVTAGCFVSYHYFVRRTFIGKFLNGRKFD